MKIVHIAQYYNPGYGYQENILPLYQQAEGHDVVLLTSTRASSFVKDRIFPAGESFDHGLRVRRLDIRWDFTDKFVCFRGLLEALEAEQPDYIFHHMPTTLSIREVCQYKRRHPDVFLAVDNHADLTISIASIALRTLYYNVFWKTFLKRYDRWIDLYFGVTPARCLFLSEELGVPAEKVRLLPIGADTDNAVSLLDRAEFLQHFGLAPDRLYLVHGGKMTADKQVDRILTAFSRIQRDDVGLLLFGTIEDPQVEALMQADPRIHHLGWLNREETLSVLSHCDLGIWNTRHTTLLEDALAMGLPLMLRYYGSTSHLIDHSGLFLYEGSTREIQDRLQSILEQPELLENYRRAAHQLREELSYRQIARESLNYVTDRAPQPIHRKFMDPAFGDTEYPGFREIRHA